MIPRRSQDTRPAICQSFYFSFSVVQSARQMEKNGPLFRSRCPPRDFLFFPFTFLDSDTRFLFSEYNSPSNICLNQLRRSQMPPPPCLSWPPRLCLPPLQPPPRPQPQQQQRETSCSPRPRPPAAPGRIARTGSESRPHRRGFSVQSHNRGCRPCFASFSLFFSFL